MLDPIISTLTAVGLSEKEANVLVALLGLGESTVTAIAEKAKLKRSITYVTLQHLMTRGFVQELPTRTIKRYAALPPARLLQYVQANTENLRMMLPLLRGLYQDHGNKPTIELHEGKEAILSVYRSMEFGKKSYYLTSWKKINEHFPEEAKRWSVNAANPKNPNEVKNIIVDDTFGRSIAKQIQTNKKQTFHLLPKSTSFEMNFGISDAIVAITSFDPLFVIVIHSTQVADCASLLFELAWQSTKPLKAT